jgi:hypothetical protein
VPLFARVNALSGGGVVRAKGAVEAALSASLSERGSTGATFADAGALSDGGVESEAPEAGGAATYLSERSVGVDVLGRTDGGLEGVCLAEDFAATSSDTRSMRGGGNSPGLGAIRVGSSSPV